MKSAAFGHDANNMQAASSGETGSCIINIGIKINSLAVALEGSYVALEPEKTGYKDD
jgi:hypothetical protein